MNEVNVKIALMPGAEIPQYAKPGDSGFDLVAQEDYVVEPGATVLVRTGIALEIPEGHEVQIRPRSGLSLNTKLRVANSPGTGDSSYRGEIKVILDNIAMDHDVPTPDSLVFYLDGSARIARTNEFNASYIIRKGDRIAQAVIAPVYRASFEVVTELSESERGKVGVRTYGDNVKAPR